MGELMGKSNIFAFVTTLFQNLSFKVPDGHDLPTETLYDGATPSVKEYSALIIKR